MRQFRPTRAIAAAALATVLVPVTAATAATSPEVTATSQGFVAGISDAYDDHDAVRVRVELDGGTATGAYCLDADVERNDTTSFTAVTHSDSGVSGIGQAAWLAANAPRVGQPLTDANYEAAATQLAIWHYTNGLDLTAGDVDAIDIRLRAIELADEARGNAITVDTASFALTANTTRDGDVATTVATVTTADGSPVAGVDVTFEFGTEISHAVTGSDGTASATGPASATGGDVTVTIDADVAAGTVLLPADGSQPLVTTAPATVTRTATADYAATAQGQPAPAPAPQNPQLADAPVEELAHTGPLAGIGTLLAGGSLVGVGAALRRRRR